MKIAVLKSLTAIKIYLNKRCVIVLQILRIFNFPYLYMEKMIRAGISEMMLTPNAETLM